MLLRRPAQVPTFRIFSWGPMSFGDMSGIIRTARGIFFTYLLVAFSGPSDVVVHRHEDDAVLEILPLNFEFFLDQFLDFLE